MKNWVISIVTIVIVNLISQIILSSSEISSFVKKIIGVITILIIISPLKSVLSLDIKEIFNDEYIVDTNFIDTINTQKEEYMSKYIEQLLEQRGFYNIDAEINYILSDYESKIELVRLNLKNLVINENQVHINKYTEIKSIVCNALGIKENIVILDE